MKKPPEGGFGILVARGGIEPGPRIFNSINYPLSPYDRLKALQVLRSLGKFS